MPTLRLSLPALDPADVKSTEGSNYPDAFKPAVAGRAKRRLGDALGLSHFGVNVTTLKPGAHSALRHWHSREDEFIYVLSGELVLVTEAGEQVLAAGMCAGFPAGRGDGHHLVNRSGRDAAYLEIGDRNPADEVTYPDADLLAVPTSRGRAFTHRDGTPY